MKAELEVIAVHIVAIQHQLDLLTTGSQGTAEAILQAKASLARFKAFDYHNLASAFRADDEYRQLRPIVPRG